MPKILPSITTCSKPSTKKLVLGENWRDKIKEANELQLTEVAFFPTCLPNKELRQEAYKLLEESSIISIPFVHLRGDMELEELDYLIKTFNTKTFNTHSKIHHALEYDLSKYKDIIYVENHPLYYLDEKEYPREENLIKEYAGICLDVAHLESERLGEVKHYEIFINYLKKYKCGAWHVSAIKNEPEVEYEGHDARYDHHTYNDLSEFDYLKRYKEYLPEFVALELENNIHEQLKAKKYIEKILI